MRSVDFSKILPKGSVLVFSLLILSIMLVTSLTILSSALLDRKASLSTGSSARSFQVADSGVEEILYQIYKKNHATLTALTASITGATCSGSTVTLPIAGGTSVVSFYQDETTLYAGGCGGTDWRDAVVKIKSEGTAGSSTRAVEVAVAAAITQGMHCGWRTVECPGGATANGSISVPCEGVTPSTICSWSGIDPVVNPPTNCPSGYTGAIVDYGASAGTTSARIFCIKQ